MYSRKSGCRWRWYC